MSKFLKHTNILRTIKCCHITYLLTPCSRVLLEKLTGSAASQEIPRTFGTRRFITVLTSARHLSLSWANSVQSPQPPPTPWRSIWILSSHLRLGLPNGLFPSSFPTRTLCTPLTSPIRATCPAHVMRLRFTYFSRHFSMEKMRQLQQTPGFIRLTDYKSGSRQNISVS